MNETLKQHLKEIVKLVGKRIKDINTEIQNSKNDLKKVDDYDVVINRIKEDQLCFASEEFINRLKSVLADSNVEDKSLLTTALEDLEYLNILSSFIDSGSFNSYKESEIAIIERLISTLEKIKAISLEVNNSQNQIVTKKTAELELCTSLYDKLRKGEDGIQHFNNSEISYLLSIISDKEHKYQYTTLELIRALELHIHKNIISFLETEEEDFGYAEDKVEEEIDEDVIIEIFKKYGIDFNIFNDKQKRILRTKCDLKRMEEVLEVLTTHSEYAFVLRYANNYGKINPKVKEIAVRKLFFIIRFATRETLEYLISDAKSRGVTVEEVFKVTGVYKKVSKTKDRTSEGGDPTDDDYLAGSYEYYKLNAKVFERLSDEYNATQDNVKVDFYKQVLEECPDVLATPAGIIERNIKFASEYGIKLIDVDHTLKAPTTLMSRRFIHLVDVLIENSDSNNNFFAYLSEYPSILKEEKTIRKALYKLYKGIETILINPNNTLRGRRTDTDPHDLDAVVNRDNIERLIANVPDSLITYIDENEYTIDKYVQDEYIDLLDNDPNVADLSGRAYLINGVRVSKMKFKRIWSLIVRSGLADNIDKHLLFMLALTYNSYYRDSDLVALQEYVSSLGLKG